ncbi:MAG: ABC transporter substrate-binding protein [Sphingobacteriales bacterium]|nr:ABC transporter substrate-binding protein [Sphingobacteriales bacterium]
MKKSLLYIIAVLLLISSSCCFAQTDSTTVKSFHIGIFTSLYLDSVFNGTQYRYDKQMPKMVIPGLDFAEGAQIALDTFNAQGYPVKAFIYDIKSAAQNINTLLAKNSFDSLDMMVGSVTGNDFKQLADIAKTKNIPFISATYPNDGGISNNPFTIILNATLNTHCSAIYNYAIKTYPTSKFVLFRKASPTDDRIINQFARLNMTISGKPLLNMPVVMLPDSFTVNILQAQLDSNRINTIIAASLDESFAVKLATVCAGLSKKYNINLIGMPNWDGIKDFSKPDFKNFPIYYPASYYNPETDKWSATVNNSFKLKTSGKAMDMVFKGFESTYYFLSLLLKDKHNFINNLSDKSFKIFTEYDLKPVRNNQSLTPDYFENKRVYLLKKINNVISKMN